MAMSEYSLSDIATTSKSLLQTIQRQNSVLPTNLLGLSS